MPAISASAPGKIILFGEHAVVYGQPAIAIPVTQVAARAVVMARPTATSGEVLIDAPDIQTISLLQDLPAEHPLARILRILQAHLGLPAYPAFHLRVTSTIPIAGGMGSGAAVAVAILRAVSAFLNCPLDDATVNQLAFESEKSFHGTPSGVDNTVITYAQPIYFRRGQPVEKLTTAAPHTFIIADSGQPGSTAEMVGAVRQRWQADPRRMESHFEQIGEIVQQARQVIKSPASPRSGQLDERKSLPSPANWSIHAFTGFAGRSRAASQSARCQAFWRWRRRKYHRAGRDLKRGTGSLPAYRHRRGAHHHHNPQTAFVLTLMEVHRCSFFLNWVVH